MYSVRNVFVVRIGIQFRMMGGIIIPKYHFPCRIDIMQPVFIDRQSITGLGSKYGNL